MENVNVNRNKIDYKTLPQPRIGDNVDLAKEFKNYEGLIRAKINKYKKIVRTQDEINDLFQDAFVIYVQCREFVLKTYGNTITNFGSLLYKRLEWDLNRHMDKKYQLIKKNPNMKKKDIFIEEDTPHSVQNLPDSSISEREILLRNVIKEALNQIPEKQADVLRFDYGLEGYDKKKTPEIAEAMRITKDDVCLLRRMAMEKLRGIFKINQKHDLLGGNHNE